ncbi:MarR family winged helix-turn-helix transcriptional regulator [Williamsia phyllosphaerae]|uniref:HTH marR-type domain-containing protein n=1 Tax=Williamsia phyllosphaerae TaxID=885042 RepID=A0ABQ1UB69_9NOCA|nr:MarR family transcriptional regulator [Williamsia phyllosphaerae]GGF14605.1 hypothetical protein GCM10007298_08350 [Williamsia phyllosphaerae]
MEANSDGARGSASELDTAERLRHAVGAFVRAVRSVSDAVGAGQIETLGLLERGGEQSIADLARRRGVRHQTMSATVAELESAGLLTRAPDPSDGRGVLIHLTDTGLETVAMERRARSGTIADAMRSLDERQRMVLDDMPGVLDQLTREISGTSSADDRRRDRRARGR